MINYSLAYKANPLDEEADKKYYAVAQYAKVMSLEEFSRHISEHGSTYKRADVYAILTLAVDCMHELILEGNKIQLGDLGSFTAKISSKGKLKAADFVAEDHIKKVPVKWTPGKMFKDLKEDANFKQVPSREIQAATLKAINGEKSPAKPKEVTKVSITKE